MKILCLHGLRHNAELMEKSMKGLIKKFKNVEFVFLNSNFTFKDESNLFCWWNADRENALTIEKYDLITESIKYIHEYWQNGNFDGILGFSQGSVVAQIFCYYIQQNLIAVTRKPKFIILCSTTLISDTTLKKFYENKLDLPICFMFGTKDPLINNGMVVEIINKINSESYSIFHSGGHYVSASKETIESLTSFFNKLRF